MMPSAVVVSDQGITSAFCLISKLEGLAQKDILTNGPHVSCLGAATEVTHGHGDIVEANLSGVEALARRDREWLLVEPPVQQCCFPGTIESELRG
jgi:hypothetical protein